MITISTDENNDIFLDDSNSISFSKDKEAIANIMTNITRTQTGELMYDNSRGIPYMETVFSNPVNIDIFEASLINSVEKIDNVVNVKSIEFIANNEILEYNMEVNTNFGEVIVNG